MPKKTEGNKDGWKGYVNWSPTATDKEKVVGVVEGKDWRLGDEINRFVESGYSVAFSWDNYSQCPRVAITGKSEICPNQGLTLSIRASSIDRLVGLAAHYSWVICESESWQVENSHLSVW